MPLKVLQDFVAQWDLVRHPKGSILSTPGKTDRHLYFTVSGIQKAYYLHNGNPNIISFTQPNHFTCAPESFLTQKPSKYYFQCISDSEFHRITHNRFTEQVHKHKEIQEF